LIRVLVVDDHPVVRRGIIQILEGEPDMASVSEAANAGELMRLAAGGDWDVVVLDINLPDRSGMEVLRDLKALRPDLPVLVLSMYPEDQYALRALKAGASGYLTKESVTEELVAAVRKAAGGGRYVSASLAEKLAEAMVSPVGKAPHELLSNREFQVMRMIASGKRLKDIAQELRLSVKTVSTYRSRVMEKMGFQSDAQLIRYALRHGLLD